MRIIRPNRASSVAAVVARAQRSQPTWTQFGATQLEETPSGYRRLHRERVIGHGAEEFARAAAGLRTWRAHASRGVRIWPVGAALALDETVVVSVGSSKFAIAAPCRIIDVVDQDRRAGFVYVTLPDHPERGEESFMVTHDEDDCVRFTVAALSAPNEWVTRLSGPVGRMVQSRATNGYLGSLARFVNSQQ